VDFVGKSYVTVVSGVNEFGTRFGGFDDLRANIAASLTSPRRGTAISTRRFVENGRAVLGWRFAEKVFGVRPLSVARGGRVPPDRKSIARPKFGTYVLHD
jgi:hypothetical protein